MARRKAGKTRVAAAGSSELEGYVGRAGAAIVLGVCSANVYKMTVAGVLPFIQTPGGKAYSVSELKKIRARREVAQKEREEARMKLLGPRSAVALQKAMG